MNEAATGCVDCGNPNVTARDRCKPHYRKFVKELKASGTFQPSLSAQPLEDRLWGQVAAGPQSCIIWTGSIDRKTGYGKIRANGLYTSPHRTSYQLAVGSIPDGMQLDHRCHTDDLSCAGGPTCLHRRCLNPSHLEIVTPGENARRTPNSPPGANARRTSCPQGHPYDAENTFMRRDGHRTCRKCRLANGQWRAQQQPRDPVSQTCKRGHPLTEDNLYRRGSINTCRICRNASRDAYKARKAAR